jgi:hypothetical protein
MQAEHRLVPRVAVVIATYHRPHLLRLAVQSVINQTFTAWQLVVVGDSCVDATEEVVASFEDPRVKFVNLSINIGEQSGPNNVGLARTTAPLVAFLNHDDLWFPDHLAIAVDTLDARQADLVFSPNLTVQPVQTVDFEQAETRNPLAAMSITVDSLAYRGRYDPSQTFRATPASSWVATRAMLTELGGWRSAEECIVEPSQDLLFRAHRRRCKLVSTGVATVVTIASGARPGSYLTLDTAEHQWFADRLANVEFRAQLLSCDGELSPTISTNGLRRRLAQHSWRAVAALGISPRVVVYRTRRKLQPGEQLRRLRTNRGLDPGLVASVGSSRVAMRRAEVLRSCGVNVPTNITFSSDGNGFCHLASGWSRPESWGVWSEGSEAELAFRLPPHKRHRIELHLQAHLDQNHRQQCVSVIVRGQEIATATLTTDGPTDWSFDVTVSATGLVILVLRFPNAFAPRSADQRVLAIGLHSILIKEVS